MTNKTTLKRLKLDPYFSKTIETNLNVWSHDQNSYEIKFEFYDHQCNKPIDLTGADMRILLDHADSKPKIYPLEIESKVLGLAKFIMPEQIRGCEGKFTAHIYADYPNRTHDFGSFTFYTKLSRLDGDLGGCMDEIYVSEFDKALEDIKEFKVDIDKNINDMKEHFDDRYDKAKTEVEEIENLIENNSVVKKSELGVLDDFRPLDEDLISKINNEFSERGVNVKWFGAKGDGETYNDIAFQKAFNSGYDTIFIPSGVYKLSHIPRKDNLTLIGSRGTKIQLDGHLLEDQRALVTFGNNSNYLYLEFESILENREWNRCDAQEKRNILVYGCSIHGFRHISSTPNAWGVYLDKSENITIKNTKIYNNTQSDVAIVEGCKNITLDNLNDGVHINLEPNTSNPKTENVSIKNTNIRLLDCLENNFHSDSFENTLILNCNIEIINYNGLNLNLVNSKVAKVNNLIRKNQGLGSYTFAGGLNFFQSISFSEKKIKDPSMHSVSIRGSSDKTFWEYYVGISSKNFFERSENSCGNCLTLNKNNLKEHGWIRNKEDIHLKPNTIYLLKLVGAVSRAGDGYFRSMQSRITLYNTDITEGEKVHLSMFRNKNNELSNNEQSFLFDSKDNTKMQLLIFNSPGVSEDMFQVNYVQVYEVGPGNIKTDNVKSTEQLKINEVDYDVQVASNIPFNNGAVLYDHKKLKLKYWKGDSWKEVGGS